MAANAQVVLWVIEASNFKEEKKRICGVIKKSSLVLHQWFSDLHLNCKLRLWQIFTPLEHVSRLIVSILELFVFACMWIHAWVGVSQAACVQRGMPDYLPINDEIRFNRYNPACAKSETNCIQTGSVDQKIVSMMLAAEGWNPSFMACSNKTWNMGHLKLTFTLTEQMFLKRACSVCNRLITFYSLTDVADGGVCAVFFCKMWKLWASFNILTAG